MCVTIWVRKQYCTRFYAEILFDGYCSSSVSAGLETIAKRRKKNACQQECTVRLFVKAQFLKTKMEIGHCYTLFQLKSATCTSFWSTSPQESKVNILKVPKLLCDLSEMLSWSTVLQTLGYVNLCQYNASSHQKRQEQSWNSHSANPYYKFTLHTLQFIDGWTCQSSSFAASWFPKPCTLPCSDFQGLSS